MQKDVQSQRHTEKPHAPTATMLHNTHSQYTSHDYSYYEQVTPSEKTADRHHAARHKKPAKTSRRRKHIVLYAVLQSIVIALMLVWGVVLPRIDTSLQDDYSALLRKQSKMQQALAGIPNPSEMIPGIINSQTRYVVNETTRQHDIIQELSSSSTLTGWKAAYSRIRNGSPLANVQRNQRGIAQEQQALRDETQAYNDTLQAILAFMEYNPRLDFQEYIAGGPDTDARLQRLSDGLQATQTSLEVLPYSSYKERLLTTLMIAQNAQNNLKQSSDVKSFITTIEALQADIQTALTAYHQDYSAAAVLRTVESIKLMQNP